MSLSLYLLVEGVTDATLIEKLLCVAWSAKKVEAKSDLPDTIGNWISEGYKWPHKGNIRRPSVPVPKILKLLDGRFVAVANGQGITQMLDVAQRDQAALNIRAVTVSAFGVVGDVDRRKRADRVQELLNVLKSLAPNATKFPNSSGDVVAGVPSLGVLVVPEEGEGITVDSILDVLGKDAYPDIHKAADSYVRPWAASLSDSRDDAERMSDVPEAVKRGLKELRAPAGEVKARIAAMGALLRPMKSFSTTLEDHDWVHEDRVDHAILQPMKCFLTSLLQIGVKHTVDDSAVGVSSGAGSSLP